jgi:hypothetical protein
MDLVPQIVHVGSLTAWVAVAATSSRRDTEPDIHPLQPPTLADYHPLCNACSG